MSQLSEVCRIVLTDISDVSDVSKRMASWIILLQWWGGWWSRQQYRVAGGGGGILAGPEVDFSARLLTHFTHISMHTYFGCWEPFLPKKHELAEAIVLLYCIYYFCVLLLYCIVFIFVYFCFIASYVFLLHCIVSIFASLHRICVILLYCIFVLFYIALLLSSLLLFISRFLTLSSAFNIFLSATRTQEVDSTDYSKINTQNVCHLWQDLKANKQTAIWWWWWRWQW